MPNYISVKFVLKALEFEEKLKKNDNLCMGKSLHGWEINA